MSKIKEVSVSLLEACDIFLTDPCCPCSDFMYECESTMYTMNGDQLCTLCEPVTSTEMGESSAMDGSTLLT